MKPIMNEVSEAPVARFQWKPITMSLPMALGNKKDR